MSQRLVLLLTLLAMQASLFGAEATAPVPPTDTGATGAQADAETPADASEAPAPEQAGGEVPATDDVFVPTVEVSEDTSVPFPVDI